MEGVFILKIISGNAKGHNLITVKGLTTRPTSGRVKDSLFNIIAEFIPSANVLDLFAGTGNLGIEALSRGAAHAVFVDYSKECSGIIKENLLHTKLFEFSEVITANVIDAVSRFSSRKFDIIFLDPPYNKNLALETLIEIEKNDIIMNDGIIVVERDFVDEIPNELGSLALKRNQKYGDTILSFYKKI